MRVVKKIAKKTVATFVLAAILGLVVFGVILEPAIKINSWSSLDENKLTKIDRTLTLLDDEENVINEFIYEPDKTFTPINQINKNTIDAFISVEDKRFFSHDGIDYKRILSAIKQNVLSGSYKEGASTITQQLIKNTHLTNEKKMSRKLQEMRIAIDLERKHQKSDILEMYLNILYFGNNIYGIGTASKIMFGKIPSELSIAESALLAGIINNPHRNNPYSFPEKAIKRRNLVLLLMEKNNKITTEEYKNALDEPLNLNELSFENTQYINNVVKEASEILNCREKDVFKKKLTIGTNIDVNMQKVAQNIINNSSISDTVLSEIIIINNLTGKINSISSNTKLNLAYTKRQPGSTIKPIISYAPALEQNLVVPITPINDEKISFNDYMPSNNKNKYYGWTSVHESLVSSSNICAIKLLIMNGIENSKAFAERCGYTFCQSDNSLALGLGGMADGLTLKQIANSYQAFANNGNFIASGCINYIKDNNGKYIYKRQIKQQRAFSPETAFYINNMLHDCAQRGTAKLLNGINNICAKTGTSGNQSGNTDAYCIAYSPDYTVAVWVGTKDYTQKTEISGGGDPTIIAKKIFEQILPRTLAGFNRPNTILELDIDANEYYENQRILEASNDTLAKFRMKAFFTDKTRPKEISFATLPDSNIDDNNFTNLDFNNFEVT